VKIKIKLILRLLLLSVVYWTGAMLLFVIVRYNGLDQEMEMFISEPIDLPLDVYMSSVFVLGIIFGITYTLVELIFSLYLKKLTPLVSIFLRSIIYFFLIIILLSVLTLYLEQQFDISITGDIVWWHEKGLLWWLKDRLFWNIVIYFITMSVMFSLLRMAYNKFGKGMFFNILIGKYKEPKEKKRILMFLDLKDSTKIAERLGHKSYSNFIQDCFKDLNDILGKYEAEVYQYVGDEAVLSWTTEKGFRNNNCVKMYYAFINRLEKKTSRYHTRYGYQPHFKAGLHCGNIMIAEVGTIKKEIAYHGDVINTTARIQGLCNELDSKLLVSETLLNKSFITLDYKSELKGDITLRGKSEKLKIYNISEKG